MLTGTITRRTQLDSGYWQYVRIMLVSSYSHIENSANSLHEKQNVGSATRVLLTNLYWQNYRPCTVQYWWSCSFKCQNPYLVRIQGMKNIETIFETFVAIVFHFRTNFSCIGQFLSINSHGVFFCLFFCLFFFYLVVILFQLVNNTFFGQSQPAGRNAVFCFQISRFLLSAEQSLNCIATIFSGARKEHYS